MAPDRRAAEMKRSYGVWRSTRARPVHAQHVNRRERQPWGGSKVQDERGPPEPTNGHSGLEANPKGQGKAPYKGHPLTAFAQNMDISECFPVTGSKIAAGGQEGDGEHRGNGVGDPEFDICFVHLQLSPYLPPVAAGIAPTGPRPRQPFANPQNPGPPVRQHRSRQRRPDGVTRRPAGPAQRTPAPSTRPRGINARRSRHTSVSTPRPLGPDGHRRDGVRAGPRCRGKAADARTAS